MRNFNLLFLITFLKIKQNNNKLVLLPHSNYIYPHFKRSLTTIQEDVEDFIRKKVNIQTG